jgi:hypothetical protein
LALPAAAADAAAAAVDERVILEDMAAIIQRLVLGKWSCRVMEMRRELLLKV